MAYLESRDYSPWETVVTMWLIDDLSEVVLAQINRGRDSITIHNGQGVLFVKYGPGVSPTSFTHRLTNNTTLCESTYSGVITAIKDTGSTQVVVTEA